MLTNDLRIVALPGTWVVRAGGAVIGETTRALELHEGTAPPVVYFPREDLGMAFLEPSGRTAHSAVKGEARYFGIVTKSGVLTDAAWSYESPLPAAKRIAGHLAFGHERVTIERV
jgi:uncharacterized protein (DUF427 family)